MTDILSTAKAFNANVTLAEHEIVEGYHKVRLVLNDVEVEIEHFAISPLEHAVIAAIAKAKRIIAAKQAAEIATEIASTETEPSTPAATTTEPNENSGVVGNVVNGQGEPEPSAVEPTPQEPVTVPEPTPEPAA